MAAEAVEIPDKVFFRIGEVATLTGVKAYVLRYWETEFGTLRPKKSRSGQRRYRRTDIERILAIKDLLWRRRFTIAGARSELNRPRTSPGESVAKLVITDPRGPAAVAAAVDPALTRQIDELKSKTVDLARKSGEFEQKALRSNRAARQFVALAERQRKDLHTIRESLMLLRGHVAAFLDESE